AGRSLGRGIASFARTGAHETQVREGGRGMLDGRKALAVLAAATALGVTGTAAAAPGPPTLGPPGPKMVVLRGTLSHFVAPTQTQPGSITIAVFNGFGPSSVDTRTLPVPLSASIMLGPRHTIQDGDKGFVMLSYSPSVGTRPCYLVVASIVDWS